MKRYAAYLLYVIRHKWFVFLGCRQMRVPLWIAIVHDWTKFLPREFFPYAHNFFNADGSRRIVRDASGAYDPNSQADAFKCAWVYHQKLRHHWQAWVSIGDNGNLDTVPMPEVFIREMIADWIGAGRAISGRKDPRPWYVANKEKMVLHPETIKMIERLLP